MTFIEALRAAGRLDEAHHPAKLIRDGQVLSIGSALLEKSASYLVFRPDIGKTLDTPIHGVTLKLLDKPLEVSGIVVEDCRGREHYHLLPERSDEVSAPNL